MISINKLSDLNVHKAETGTIYIYRRNARNNGALTLKASEISDAVKELEYTTRLGKSHLRRRGQHLEVSPIVQLALIVELERIANS